MSPPTSTPDTEPKLSDAESDSSSVVYDHEPFETFRNRVLELAQTLWATSSADDIEIERMAGGGFNRIIGISRKVSGYEGSDQYVLRIPRLDAANLDRDVAALYFVSQLGGIPIPDVVSFDETSDNKLSLPYMVQNRLPGTDLYSAYPTLEDDAKCKIAGELGHVFQRMLSAKNSAAGLFGLPPKSNSSETRTRNVVISPLFEVEHLEPKFQPSSPIYNGTLDLLVTTLNARNADGMKRFPADTARPKLTKQFVAMASELDADGWFKDVPFSLCHLDLAPRNILVGHAADGLDMTITGILDWDSALLAPSFMSCAPPLWIWAWSDDEDEDERTANDTPATEQGKALKSAFEEAAGSEYMRYAYSPAYRLARRLVRFAVDGVTSNEDVDEAETMLREWAEIREALKSTR
jgi:hypothetical protein